MRNLGLLIRVALSFHRFLIGIALTSISGAAAAISPPATAKPQVMPSLGVATSVCESTISDDDGYLLTRECNGETKLWDLKSRTLIRVFAGPNRRAVLAPDGKKVAVLDITHNAVVMESGSGHVVARFDIQGTGSALAFSRQSQELLVGNDGGNLTAWDIASTKSLRQLQAHSASIFHIVSSDHNEMVFTSGKDGYIRQWEEKSLRLKSQIRMEKSFTQALNVSENGQTLAIGMFDGSVSILNTVINKIRILPAQGNNPIAELYFDRNGRIVSFDADGVGNVWDLNTLNPQPLFKVDAHNAHSAAVFKRSLRAVAAGKPGSLALYDIQNGYIQDRIPASRSMSIGSPSFGPNDEFVAARAVESWPGDEGYKFLWSPRTGVVETINGASMRGCQSRYYIRPENVHIGFDEKGQIISTYGVCSLVSSVRRELAEYKMDRGGLDFDEWTKKIITSDISGWSPELLRSNDNDKYRISFGEIIWSQDLHLAVAYQAEAGNVILFERCGGACVREVGVWGGHLVRPLLAVSSNGIIAALSSAQPRKDYSGVALSDQKVVLFDRKNPADIRTFEVNSSVSALSISADGGWLAVGDDTGHILTFDISEPQNKIEFQADTRIKTLVFSFDAGQLAAVTPSQIHIIPIKYQQGSIQHLSNPLGVDSVAFSLNNQRLLSAGEAAQLWDLQTGQLLASSFMFTGKDTAHDWVTITPEGFFDASANGAKYLNVVQGLDVYSIDQAYQSLYRPDLVREKLAGDPDGKVRDAAAKLDLDKVIGSGKAPAARFTSPDAKATVSGTEVAAEVELTDAGGGVGKVEWRVNGTTLGIDDGGLARQAGGAGRTVRLRRTLPLGPGDAAVEVVAYNAGNLLASDPVRIELSRPAVPAVADAAPRLFVLAAGINDYWDGRLRLRYAVPDAKALSEGLRQAGQGLYADVEVTTLLDADVTAAKLDQAFADLGRRMGPSDVFIFFIAGHGKTVDGHYHFIPWDFRYENAASIAQNGIDQSRFQAWLARVPARKSLLLTDTCESGSLTEDQQVASARGLDLVAAQQAATELLTRAVGRTVLAASTDDAPALEGYHGHGVFSYAVLDALSHAAVKSDGLITVTELAGYVDRRVPELSYAAFHQRQIPQMRIVGSNFPILTRIAAVPEAGGDDVVPDRPTHVVTAPVTVRKGADAASDVVVSLQPGSQVAVVRSADGWTLVARDGQKLGYVEDKNLARLQ